MKTSRVRREESAAAPRVRCGPPAAKVRELFASIAPTYDRLNRTLSFGQDVMWRRRLVRDLPDTPDAWVLDLCAGTGDVAFRLTDEGKGKVLAGDFCLPMLHRGRQRRPKAGVRWICCDGLALPFRDESVAAVTVAFGVRNFEDMPAGFAEMMRVLRPGGQVRILEFHLPRGGAFAAVYRFYLGNVLPFIGRVVSRRRDAYHYLRDSVQAFPDAPTVGKLLREAGFADVTHRRLTAGIVAIHLGRKA